MDFDRPAVAVAVLIGLALSVALVPGLRGRWRSAAAILLCCVASAGMILGRAARREPWTPEIEVVGRPIQVADDGYVSSDACRACHRREYETWDHSYHQSMTQIAGPETVIPSFDGVELRRYGRT